MDSLDGDAIVAMAEAFANGDGAFLPERRKATDEQSAAPIAHWQEAISAKRSRMSKQTSDRMLDSVYGV